MLLRKSEKDYNIANSLVGEWDEEYLDNACYHLQQAIEKALKAYIELNGAEYNYTHNITELYTQCKNLGFPEYIELDLMSGTISNWEASSRYNDEFFATLTQIESAKEIYTKVHEIVIEKQQEIEQQEQNINYDSEEIDWE